jgi:hypothetical protein
MKFICGIAFLIVLISANAYGQVIISQKSIGVWTIDTPVKETSQKKYDILDRIKNANDLGDWGVLKEELQLIIAAVNTQAPNTIDPKTNFYTVVLAAPDLKNKPALMRFLYSERKGYDNFFSRLPGLAVGEKGNLYEIYLHLEPKDTLRSTYVSTEQPNPLVAQIPAFVRKFEPSAILPLVWPQAAVERETKKVTVQLTQILLVHKRATIDVKDLVSVPAGQMTSGGTNKLSESIKKHQALYSPCGQQLSDKIQRRMVRVIEDSGQNTAGLNDRLKENIVNEYSAFVDSNQCPFDEATVLASVEKAYLTAVSKESEYIENGAKFTNIPYTSLNFGLLGTYIAYNHPSSARAKISNGIVTPDPIKGALSMAVLNIYPKPYDAEALHMTKNERLRLFVGGILAPEFGVGGGVGFGIVRGLSLNFGGGLLFISTLKEGEQFGNAPVNKENPFKTGTAAVLFAGIGYNF